MGSKTAANWGCGPLAALDFETTGPDPTEARVVQWAFAYDLGTADSPWKQARDRPRQVRTGLVNPGVSIPRGASEVHGIVDADVEECAPFHVPEGGADCAALRLARYIGWTVEYSIPLVVYNAPFDLTLYVAECKRTGAACALVDPGRDPLVVDPLVLDRALDRYRKGKRTLERAVEVYGVEVADEGHHDAGADCLMAIDVARAIARRHSVLTRMGGDGLFGYQHAAFYEWRRSFNEYRAKRGQPPIGDDWPVRSAS